MLYCLSHVVKLFWLGWFQVIKDQDYLIDERRVFYSDIRDDNPLSCISRKIKINQFSPNVRNIINFYVLHIPFFSHCVQF